MKHQRGGFLMGLIVGLLGGLAVALAVALYVTKVPIPFINKVPARSGERDAQETEKNRNWDPNAPLQGKNAGKPIAPLPSTEAPARPSSAETHRAEPTPRSEARSEPRVAPPAEPRTEPRVATPAEPRTESRPAEPRTETRAEPRPDATRPPASRRDPAAILADRPGAAPAGDPLAAGRSRDDPFSYFIQAGAYGRTEEAEQQRAKLALLGLEARVTEREQAGRTVYRVRVGPYNQKEQADRVKERLEGAAVEAALVRVQK